MGIRLMDLSTGYVTTLFQIPHGGWIDAVAVSPDHKLMILSYSPPNDSPYGGIRTLYSLPLQESSAAPQLLFAPASEYDQYYQPEWSSDGKFLYFAHQHDNQGALTYDIWRMPYPNGQPTKLADNAVWPRGSNDGAQLVYVSINPETRVNRVVLANADGTNPHKIPTSDLPTPIIDAPMFSADGQSIFFSSPHPGQSSVPGATPVRLNLSKSPANGSIPADWWSVPATGGKVEQVTNIQSLGLYGNLSPDKKHIALYTADGMFVMNPDGSGLTVVVEQIGQLGGTVSWLP